MLQADRHLPGADSGPPRLGGTAAALPAPPHSVASSPADDLHNAKDKGRQGVGDLHAGGDVHLGKGRRAQWGRQSEPSLDFLRLILLSLLQ